MGTRVDVVVVGGGVIGCAIAYELVRAGIDAVVVVERGRDVGEGASKANSGIVHTGFDATPGTIEAEMLRRARDLWPDLVGTLGVPFLEVGALMLARSAADMDRLRRVYAPGATAMGVATQLLTAAEVREMAPYATDAAVGGMAIPGESVIDPFWLTRAFAEAAMAGGAQVLRGVAVTTLSVATDGVMVGLADGRTLEAAQAIDAAGLQADEVAALAGAADFAIAPRRGQFLVSEETFGVDRIVLPVPGPMGKGMLVTPIVFGGILLGPTATDTDDKADRAARADDTRAIRAAVEALVPATRDAVAIRSFVGLRPVPSTGGFLMRPSRAGDRLWLACGIRSTGISASPAVAERVTADVLRARGWASRPRPVAPSAVELADAPGEVVCLCRGVSKGELVGACHRPLGPLTLDGLKRRGGAMFGDCQGNLCATAAAEVLADALDVPVTTIERADPGSWLFAPMAAGAPAGDDAPAAVGAATSPERLDGAPAYDLVVVGLGHAGGAALATARDAGLRAVGVGRGMGWTAVGLLEGDQGWEVEAQGPGDATTVVGRAVLLATGGFVEPREQRAIVGPRLSGIVTSDLVDAALASGLLPGRVAVVVGGGVGADRTVASLAAAGVRVAARLAGDPLEVAGIGRLEAVLTADGWVRADTLVLADRLLPQPFLLRGLGLVDGRPGSPAPADADGRLPSPGLWAAGCCVTADIDHARCADEGRRVARNIARDLRVGVA